MVGRVWGGKGFREGEIWWGFGGEGKEEGLFWGGGTEWGGGEPALFDFGMKVRIVCKFGEEQCDLI